MEQLHEKYAPDSQGGLRILAFPSNQFGNQEPGSETQIKEYVTKFNVAFDMFSKIDVNGEGEHPLFTYLKATQTGFITE